MKNLSAWDKGVAMYKSELREALNSEGLPVSLKNMLNGADSWLHFSEGGCALIYDSEIAERLSTPGELKKTKAGKLPPNSRESWLDVQARALHQAAQQIIKNHHDSHRI